MLTSNLNSQTAFSGRLSAETLQMAYDTLGASGYESAKKFRAGKNRLQQITVKYISEPVRDQYGRQIAKTDTFMEVKNPNSKKAPVRMLLSEGKLLFGENMLNKIKQKMMLLDRK